MADYVAPELELKAFTCPACGVLSQQLWTSNCFASVPGANTLDGLAVQRCRCVACRASSIWSTETRQQIHPRQTAAPMPHPDLPDDCALDYLEARNVAADSPRSAAALLRLCVQKLLPKLGAKGKTIDAGIADLVAKGLPEQIKDALDICRVIGNNAVHPGEIDVNDDPGLVAHLFDLINFIVDQTLARQKTISALLAKFPQGTKDAIAKRDSKATSAAVGPAPQSLP
jgi:hypothetical protein